MAKITQLACKSKTTKSITEIDTQDHSARSKRLKDMTASLKKMHAQMQERSVWMGEEHPLIGQTYARLSPGALQKFLQNAQVIHEDTRFISYSLLVGTHGRKKKPFVCVKNRLEDGLHLLIGDFNAQGV